MDLATQRGPAPCFANVMPNGHRQRYNFLGLGRSLGVPDGDCRKSRGHPGVTRLSPGDHLGFRRPGGGGEGGGGGWRHLFVLPYGAHLSGVLIETTVPAPGGCTHYSLPATRYSILTMRHSPLATRQPPLATRYPLLERVAGSGR